MERVVILKNTVTGQELTMPVTPSTYPVASGRAVEHLDMALTGQLALPGLNSLFSEPLDVMLPAQLYPFCTAGAVADPQYYLELLSSWSKAGDVCRYIVSGAGINVAVLLGPIEHKEKDGSNDVYARIPLHEYRYLDEVLVEQTQNMSRTVENNNQKTAADSYIVEAGDSLWSIAKRFYGDGALGYKLATANHISNPDLIFPGQILTLPDAASIDALSATASKKTASSTPTAAAPTELTAETVTQTLIDVRASIGLNPASQRYVNNLIDKFGVKT